MASENYKVYIHILPNNKVYVGITSRELYQRWGRNGSGYKISYFKNAIKKYGWDNIQHILITDGLCSYAAKQMEKTLIKFYKSNNKEYGYNLTEGGDGSKGYKMTEEQRKELSQKIKGRKLPHTEEWNKKISEAHKHNGVKHTWYTGHKMTEEQREKNKQRYKGKHWIINSEGRRQWV